MTRLECFQKTVPGRRPESSACCVTACINCHSAGRETTQPSCFQSLALTRTCVFFPSPAPAVAKTESLPPSVWCCDLRLRLSCCRRRRVHLFNQPPRSLLIIKRRVALQAPPPSVSPSAIYPASFFPFFFLSPLGVADRLARADKLAGANLLSLRGGWALRVGQPLPSPSGH